MSNKTLYTDAHLIVSAIRVLEHQHAAPPTLEAISEMLSMALDETNRLCRKIETLGIIETVTKAGETRLFVADHLAIENIETGNEKSDGTLSAELAEFQKAKDAQKKKIENIRAQQKKKREALRQELDRKLKGGLKDDE
ncbi:MAG: hypothetical protein ACQERN_02710 [Thermodesulfobacteriota bacterium]